MDIMFAYFVFRDTSINCETVIKCELLFRVTCNIISNHIHIPIELI